MSRIAAAAFLILALSLALAQTVSAQSQPTAQESANAECPAPKPPTSVYAGVSKPPTYTIPDPSDPDTTISVKNLSQQKCTQSCASDGGGTVTGVCVLKDSQPECQAETTCSGQKPQSVTTQQVQDAVNATQSQNGAPNNIVSQEFQMLPNSSAQTPASIVSQNFPQSASNMPIVSVPASWLQQVGTEPSSNGSVGYANQSILTQALNSLEGNSSGQTGTNVSVPTTQEQYLQTTFGTTPSGETVSVDSSLPTSNSFVAATRDNSTGLSDWLQQVNGIAQNASAYGCTAATCVVLNTGDQAIVYNATSPIPGTYLLQSSGSQATGLWSAIAGVTPADEAAYLQNGVPVSTPQGTVSLQMGSNLADAAGQALATDYNNSSILNRLDAYFSGTPAGVSTSYLAPSSQTPDVSVTPPLIPAEQAANVTLISAQEYAQLCSGCSQAPQAEAVSSAPTTPVESQPLAPIESASQQSQDSGHVSETSQPQQTPGQTQGAGTQSAQSAAQSPQPAGSQPSPQPQPANAANQVNTQAGGQTPAAQQAGGATGGDQTNQGGAGQSNDITNLIAGFLSGLLQGALSPSSPAPAARPIVYSPTQPIVAIPATSEGVLGPCQRSTQTSSQQKQQSPCGATTNTMPAPQLVNSLPAPQTAKGTGGASQNSNQNTIQTIIPAKTQTPANGTNSANTSGPPPTSQQGGNNTPVNPQGTQQGPTGASNPTGSQKGGTGAPSTAPGSGATQPSPNPSNTQPTPTTQQSNAAQPSPSGQGNGTGSGVGSGSQPGAQGPRQNTTPSLLQRLANALGTLFSAPAKADEAQAQKSIKDQAQRDLQIAQQALETAKGLTWWPNAEEKKILEAGNSAAHRLVSEIQQLGNPGLSSAVQKYVNAVESLKKPENQNQTNFNAANAMGDHLVKDVEGYLGGLATIGPIGNPAPSPQTPAGQTTAGSETPPASAPAQPPAPPVVAKGLPFTGAASVYDCRLGGINGNCAQSATGGLGVNPSEYSAALQVGYAKVFQTGYGQGNVGYALVENLDTGRQMIVNVNDNGPLTPGRVIDFSPATMNCLAYGNCNNDSTLNSTVLPNVKVTVLQGTYTPGLVANGTLPTAAACNYRGCASPTPNDQVAAARVSNLTTAQNCSGATTLCASDPTTGAAFTCQGDQNSCLAAFQKQLALSRACASNPSTCNANATTYKLQSNGTATPPPEPRKVFPITNAYGVTGKVARNPNVPTVSGISSQDLISRLRAAGVPVNDMSSASLSNYPHGKNEMTALTWHGDGSSGSDPSLVSYEISQNNSGAPAAQAVLQQDGTLTVVAPLDAVSFHAATMNKLGPGIEIQGMNNQGANPTPAQMATMQKITSVVMDQLGWEAAAHGQIEPEHKDANEAGPATIAYVYSGVAPAPVPTYTLTDANGDPVIGPDANPVTTTQAPAADGTAQFLTNPDGTLLLDANGKPIPLNPVPVTQSLSNPNVYSAPDDRPQQPVPANPWAGQQPGNPNAQYMSAAPIGQASGGQQATVQQPYQTYPQQLPSPLPLTATATSTVATSTSPAVSIVANPTSISSGGTTELSWSSVDTTRCSVTTSAGLQLSAAATSGSALSPKLYETTVFSALCQTQASSTVSATASVGVQ